MNKDLTQRLFDFDTAIIESRGRSLEYLRDENKAMTDFIWDVIIALNPPPSDPLTYPALFGLYSTSDIVAAIKRLRSLEEGYNAKAQVAS